MTLEDMMGAILFLLGVILITISFLAVIDLVSLVSGWMIPGFSIFGFILCVTGFMMARSVMGGVMNRFRR